MAQLAQKMARQVLLRWNIKTIIMKRLQYRSAHWNPSKYPLEANHQISEQAPMNKVRQPNVRISKQILFTDSNPHLLNNKCLLAVNSLCLLQLMWLPH